MAISKPPPLHFTFFHNQDSSIDTSDSNLALSIDTSRRRRDVLLTISGTLIPQLFFFDRKRSSSANAADFFNFGAPPPEPERTVELAQV
ncbi:PQL3 [Arabidopsis thaliana]|jgi:hypothetical protein|uniref:PQL3 n=1 Tax=Arabidopsis thaliana TaxID=3702 RepID=A0A178VPV6_ARATH|nr:PQL3 [Arabidopsis thaliana]